MASFRLWNYQDVIILLSLYSFLLILLADKPDFLFGSLYQIHQDHGLDKGIPVTSHSFPYRFSIWPLMYVSYVGISHLSMTFLSCFWICYLFLLRTAVANYTFHFYFLRVPRYWKVVTVCSMQMLYSYYFLLSWHCFSSLCIFQTIDSLTFPLWI